jgi:hypothetical protein
MPISMCSVANIEPADTRTHKPALTNCHAEYPSSVRTPPVNTVDSTHQEGCNPLQGKQPPVNPRYHSTQMRAPCLRKSGQEPVAASLVSNQMLTDYGPSG